MQSFAPSSGVASGEIAAIMVRDLIPEATLKIVRRTRSTLTLAPANPAYTPLEFKGSRRGLVSIVGRFVGVVPEGLRGIQAQTGQKNKRIKLATDPHRPTQTTPNNYAM